MYLAFCAEDRNLVVFPSHGSISAPAGMTTVAPGKDASLVVDGRLGSETLYVILSRADLVTTDPRLADAIHTAQPGEAAADCGPRFQLAVTAGSPAEAAEAHAGPAPESGAGRRPPQDRRGGPRRIDHAGAGVPGDSSLRHVSSADDDERPLVTIERGMYVGQNGLMEVTISADANGIAILRYRFDHVAVPRP
jgi:hypothetical protein